MRRRPRRTRRLTTTTPSSAADTTTTQTRPAGDHFAGRSVVSALGLLLAASIVLGACAAESADTSAATSGDGVSPPAGFDVQGHRGARGLRPENTLPSFETALDLGVTTLELDLHFSADDQVVVWHDAFVDPAKCRLDRDAPPGVPDPDTAPGPSLAIRALTVEQLSRYTCDRNPDRERFPDQVSAPTPLAGADFRIVTLGEVFDFVATYAGADTKTAEQRESAGVVAFNVETKRVRGTPRTIGDGFDGETPGPFELALLTAIEEAGIEDRVVVQSFDHRSLRAIRAVDSDIRLAALTGDPVSDPGGYVEWGASIWSPRASTVDLDGINAAHDAGLFVIPWTVNDPGEMQSLIELGVDGLITDRPDLVPQGS